MSVLPTGIQSLYFMIFYDHVNMFSGSDEDSVNNTTMNCMLNYVNHVLKATYTFASASMPENKIENYELNAWYETVKHNWL